MRGMRIAAENRPRRPERLTPRLERFNRPHWASTRSTAHRWKSRKMKRCGHWTIWCARGK